MDFANDVVIDAESFTSLKTASIRYLPEGYSDGKHYFFLRKNIKKWRLKYD